MDQTGHISCQQLLEKTNQLLKAALHENKVKQLAIDTFAAQSSTKDDHIQAQAMLIIQLKDDITSKDQRITTLQTRESLLLQTIAEHADQLSLQQQLISKLQKAIQQDKHILDRQSKELSRLQGIRHGRNLLAKDKFGRRSEKTHTPPVLPKALLANGVSPEELARIKEIFDITGYAVLEKKDRRCPSLREQGVPVETIIVDVDKAKLPAGYLQIGENVTEKVVFVKAKLYIKRYVQPVYLIPDLQKGETYFKNVSEPMPAELLRNRCGADVTLQVQLVIDKYLYGMPVHRQNQVFEQAGARLPLSSMYDWNNKTYKALSPLYDLILREMIKCGMVHMDETGLLVIDKTRQTGKKSHRGYLLGMINPVLNFACFKYAKGRGHLDIGTVLEGFKGILHTDALGTYKRYGNKAGVSHGLCFTHARRRMVEAKECDLPRSKHALKEFINPLYAIERKCKKEGMTFDQTAAYRQKYAAPILEAFHQWLLREKNKVIPRSAIAIAINYILNNWKGLTLYITDGMMQLDNNVLERQIRIVAVTRKNFMFAGSHQAAQNAAIIYTFIASCKLQNIDPQEWLTDVLLSLPKHPKDKLADLLPHNWKKVAVKTAA